MNNYTWTKTFEQISEWLLNHENNQSYLVSVLKKIGIEGGLLDYDSKSKFDEIKAVQDKEHKKGLILKNTVTLSEIDPFTFISLILKNSKQENLNKLLLNLKGEIPELHIPTDFKGVPTPNPQGSWFFAYKFDRKVNDILTLWNLFKAIHKKKVLEDKFNAALEVKYTALASLSQMLFVFFPHQFFPVDGQTHDWLSSRELPHKKNMKWNEYKILMTILKNNYKADFPKLSYTCWFINQWAFDKENVEELLSARLDRITDGVQYIRGFKTENGKHLALQVKPQLKNFNIILEEQIPNEFELKSEMRIVGSANIVNHAERLANKEVCVIRTYKNFNWYDFLLVLDWYEGSIINPISISNLINKIKEAKNMLEVDEPLNQILSGPPGTGKTYATTELAVKIAAPQWYLSLDIEDGAEYHAKIKEKYDELIQKDQIAFTTFHQSFAYEDFIEGLKAYIPEGQDKIAYQVEDGVFKKIALLAEKSQGIVKETNIKLNDAPKIWKISLGERGDVERRQRYFKNQEIRIGWNSTGDLREEKDEKESDYYEKLKSNAHSTLFDFSERMDIGDVVLCLKDQTSVQGIGVITSDYYFDKVAYEDDGDFAHVRNVNWLDTDIDFNILSLNHNKNLTLKTVYELYRMSWSKILDELKNQNIKIDGITDTTQQERENRNYVLIMDEINRGNISKIFGELITLIEDDKRNGRADARELILPYSKELFSVPSNLYLIGTMNTADKSLTQLDLALRRRFEFKEILPNASVLEAAKQYDVDVVSMLQKINQRIQCLKGKDFQIGHSYFMPLCKQIDNENKYLELLQRIFRNKILPLLQEYFFSNLKLISLILNDNPNSESKDQIISQIENDQSLFTFEPPNKLNPLHCVELNLDCFSSLERFRQIYQ
ncbi:AAA family ATPase [Acinetobacter sp.]|uniref:AAA family ATPase n=1 Tax=Acinetobacter sp. TaxID=472 RepID=UPI003B005085